MQINADAAAVLLVAPEIKVVIINSLRVVLRRFLFVVVVGTVVVIVVENPSRRSTGLGAAQSGTYIHTGSIVCEPWASWNLRPGGLAGPGRCSSPGRSFAAPCSAAIGTAGPPEDATDFGKLKEMSPAAVESL